MAKPPNEDDGAPSAPPMGDEPPSWVPPGGHVYNVDSTPVHTAALQKILEFCGRLGISTMKPVPDDFVSMIEFSEGPLVILYKDRYRHYEKELLVNLGVSMSQQQLLLCAYLALKSLTEDNNHTSAGINWTQDALFPCYKEYIDVIQAEFLRIWIGSPAIITQIDIWVQRKWTDYVNLLQTIDLESFYKWNLVILHQIKAHIPKDAFIEPKLLPIHNMLETILLGNLDRIPSYFARDRLRQVLSQQSTSIPPGYLEAFNNLFSARLIFQKLITEVPSIRDPYLRTGLERIQNSLNAAIATLPAQTTQFHRWVSSAEAKILQDWASSARPLVDNNVQQEGNIFFLRMERILKRLLVIVGSTYPQLKTDIMECATQFAHRADMQHL